MIQNLLKVNGIEKLSQRESKLIQGTPCCVLTTLFQEILISRIMSSFTVSIYVYKICMELMYCK